MKADTLHERIRLFRHSMLLGEFANGNANMGLGGGILIGDALTATIHRPVGRLGLLFGIARHREVDRFQRRCQEVD